MKRVQELAEKLKAGERLTTAEYEEMLCRCSEETAQYLAQEATAARKKCYGTEVYLRGLIEISNICKNDCLYCGIRRSNRNCERYRLSEEEILSCVREGDRLGFRTFVLQGGEDAAFDDAHLCRLIARIKEIAPGCAVTLSLGERSRESYRRLFDAGADRYLLRHETANREHYARLHPAEMSYDARIRCLSDLKEIGYQVGCGFMVGSPYQTISNLAQDLKFTERFQPDMCGIGPFVPHRATAFCNEAAGSVALTCYLLSILRLIDPTLLIPATTALATLDPHGRELGILSGANVVMPNLSPQAVREKYELYDHKAVSGSEAAESVHTLEKELAAIGYQVVRDRGDKKS